MEKTKLQPLFKQVLNQHLSHSGLSQGELAKLASLPKQTVASWIQGRVSRPRRWQDIVNLADALSLNKDETNEILRAAQHKPIAQLNLVAQTEADQVLLNRWVNQVAPFQAIADPPNFVGRKREQSQLEEQLLSGKKVRICSIEGMGGIGKTTLAARLAHRLRPHFPDGVLWARLGTCDPLVILASFAAAYGQEISHLPDLDSRTRIVCGILARKHVLIVLDNVECDEQIRPLLFAANTCAILITSRRQDLWSVRGGCKLVLQPLDVKQEVSLALFEQMLGQEVVLREHQHLLEIAELLGHLPLAIEITATRLAHEPGWTVAGFLNRLRQDQHRLEELCYGEIDVPSSFKISYAGLAPEEKQFFAAMGVFREGDFDSKAAAYVSNLEVETAKDRLRALYRLSLVQVVRPGRWQLHSLLADFARQQCCDDLTWVRMVDYFVNYAVEHVQNHQILRTEMSNILHALEIAYKLGLRAELMRGANALAGFWRHISLDCTQVNNNYLERMPLAVRIVTDAGCEDSPMV
jgi:hypothetical protein